MRGHDPLSLRQIAVFVALIDERSFTRAAKSLGLSQSTVSGHVADLERRLGVRLVERERGGVRPTAAGSALIRPARDMLQAERNARMALHELSGLMQGDLRVGASTIPASYLLPRLLAKFHEEHPDIRLTVETGDSAQIIARVRDADLEVGIVGKKPDDASVNAMAVADDRLVLVVAADSSVKSRVDAMDLLSMPLVTREKGSGTREASMSALRSLLSDKTGDLSESCQVGSTEAQCAAVAAGLGAALISSLAAKADVERGVLREVRVKGLDVRRTFYVVTRPDEYLSPAGRAFRAILG